MPQSKQTSYTFTLDVAQQAALRRELAQGNYLPASVPHAVAAADRPGCRIALFKSGKCLVQGREASDWVQFVMEPCIVGAVVTAYDQVLHTERFETHMGIDESGKGDYFGPLVIAAAYADAGLVREFDRLGVKDSKRIGSDRKALELAEAIRRVLRGRFALVTIGPRAYNRLYASIRNVNRLLAWGHARAIENLLDREPDCPRAVADQFGPEERIRSALMKRGRSIELVQRHKAEADPAVAAASILARAAFLDALKKMGEEYGRPFPKGAGDPVRTAAVDLVRARGPNVLLDTVKCHFQTTDRVLAEAGADRSALEPDGQVTAPARGDFHRGRRAARKPTGEENGA